MPSSHKLVLQSFWADEGLSGRHWLLPVLAAADWTHVPLVHCGRINYQFVRFPGRTVPHGDSIWLDLANGTTVTSEAVHQGQARGAPATSGSFRWEAVPSTLDSFLSHTSDVRSPRVSPSQGPAAESCASAPDFTSIPRPYSTSLPPSMCTWREPDCSQPSRLSHLSSVRSANRPSATPTVPVSDLSCIEDVDSFT